MSDHIDIASLFTKDPRQVTNAEFEALIRSMRENREKYIVDGDAQAGSTVRLTERERKASSLGLKIDI